MDSAVVLAIISGALWGLNMVASRWGLDATGVPSNAGAFVSNLFGNRLSIKDFRAHKDS